MVYIKIELVHFLCVVLWSFKVVVIAFMDTFPLISGHSFSNQHPRTQFYNVDILPSERLYSKNGQFRAAMLEDRGQNTSDKVILKEFEKFVDTVGTRLAESDTWADEDAPEFQRDGKQQVKKMLSALLGGHTYSNRH
jgi:hypothetical protein